jgi:hypothetical protein
VGLIMRRPLLVLLLVLCVAAVLAVPRRAAAEPSGSPSEGSADMASVDVASIVGINLAQAGERYGTPAHVFVVRGDEPWQDDVVFRYASGLYLFWYEDTVWQVRLDLHFTGEFLQLRMGASREQVRELLGKPWGEEEDALVYDLEDRGYPLRLRLYFDNDLLMDAYCYRGDL